MTVTITPTPLRGSIPAVPSKSAVHRLLIAAALAERPTRLYCGAFSRDLAVTAEALGRLGAELRRDGDGGLTLIPLRREALGAQDGPRVLEMGESGSTLRFLLPVVCALGLDARFLLEGRLPRRPLAPLWEALERHGCRLRWEPEGSLRAQGRLTPGAFSVAADLSSQFISGLLLAAPLLGAPSTLRLLGRPVSEGYIRMTQNTLALFGLATAWEGDRITVSPGAGYRSPGEVRAEGDWSAAAFWEIAGMLSDGGGGGLTCTGLDDASLQGDRAVRRLKGEVARGGAVIDASQIPDLLPPLAVLAAVSPGTTVFCRAGRLRLKESDRVRSTAELIRSLGGRAEETPDGLTVTGVGRLKGGRADCRGDHRILMSAAVASIACEGDVVLPEAQGVEKSYPSFWEDFERLGGRIRREP